MIFYIVSMWPNSIIYDKEFVINQFLDNFSILYPPSPEDTRKPPKVLWCFQGV